MNIYQFLSILLARYKIALFMLIATVLGAFLFTLLMPDKYVASTSVVLDVKSPDPLLGMVLTGLALPSYIATQTDIITSQRVAQSVVKLLKFDENPQVREQWRTATQGKGQFEAWLGNLLSKKLEVRPSRDSNVIEISYTSEDPVFAAVAANAFTRAYINTNLELKVEPAKQYAEWFQERVATLRVELEKAQARLAAFQKETGMVGTGNRLQSVENSKIAELSGQLVVTEGQSADLQSKEKYAGRGDTLVEVMQNQTILNLKSDLIRLEGRLQEASLNLGRNNPQFLAMESQIASLKQKMADETRQILSSINTANSINKQKKSELKSTIESQKQKVIEDSTHRDQIAVLERDVESAQKTYDIVVQRYTESNLQSQTNQTNITVLTPAIEPTSRSSPNMFRSLVIAVFVGTLLGVGGTLIVEIFDQRIRTAELLESATGVLVLVHFKKNSNPRNIKMWLEKMAGVVRLKLGAARLKLRFRRPLTVS